MTAEFVMNKNPLIPCRQKALDMASALRVAVNGGGRFHDLLAFYKGQWHYITTNLNQHNHEQHTDTDT
jgi:hypothetical protein